MKKLLFLVIAISSLSACSSSGATEPVTANNAPATSSSKDSTIVIDSMELDSIVPELVVLEKGMLKQESLIGLWEMKLRVTNGKVEEGIRETHVEYKKDSLFEIEELKVVGKWWLSDSLLVTEHFGKKGVELDTAKVVSVSEDTLTVNPFRDNFIFKLVKVSK